MMDFNGVKDDFQLIPENTIVKAVLNIKSGDVAGEPYLTRGKTGSIFVNCDFTVTEGQYSRRKIFYKIGISGGSEQWINYSKVFIKNLLESARHISKSDQSEHAQAARKINSYADLDGLEVVVKVDIEENDGYMPRNRIICVITPDHKLYREYTSGSEWYA